MDQMSTRNSRGKVKVRRLKVSSLLVVTVPLGASEPCPKTSNEIVGFLFLVNPLSASIALI